MSFWDLSDGENAAQTASKEYEVPGGNFDPIPNNSDVLALLEEIKWKHKDDKDPSSPRYIEGMWCVLQPEAFKNRKVYHKLWVTDLDPNAKDEAKGKTKRDKARRMLAAIDANAGGNLARSGAEPTDDSLTLHLCNKPMVIKLMTWSMKASDGSDMAGNWVSAVKPSDAPLHISDEKPPKASSGSGQTPSAGNNNLDDEIPF